MAARPLHGGHRAAVSCRLGQCAAAAGLVCPHRASARPRSLFPVRRQQSGQPDRAAGLSLRPGAGLRAEGAEPAVVLRLPRAAGGPRARLHADAQAPERGCGGCGTRCGGEKRLPRPRLLRPGPDRLGWIGLALVPAALLTAFTTHVTTDIASAPLLWVLPLSLYLLTFVLVFRDKPLIPAPGPAAGASRGRGHGAAGAGADQARQLVRHRHDRRHRVLRLGHGGAPNALRGAADCEPPHRVLPVDVVRRRAGRPVGGADRAQDLQRGVRVSAAARPVDGLPARRLQRRRPAPRVGQHRHGGLAPEAAAPPSRRARDDRGRQAGGAGAVADRRRRHPGDLLAALGARQAPLQSRRVGHAR